MSLFKEHWQQTHYWLSGIIVFLLSALWIGVPRGTLSAQAEMVTFALQVAFGIFAAISFRAWFRSHSLEGRRKRRRTALEQRFTEQLQDWQDSQQRDEALKLVNPPEVPSYLKRDLRTFRPVSFKPDKANLTQWYVISRCLFHIARLSRRAQEEKLLEIEKAESGAPSPAEEAEEKEDPKETYKILKDLERTTRDLYFSAWKIIRKRISEQLLGLVAWLAFFPGFALAKLLFGLSQRTAPTPVDWDLALMLLILGVLFSLSVHNLSNGLCRWFVERTESELDDLLVGIVSGPVSVVVFAWVALLALQSDWGLGLGTFFSGRRRTVALILLATWIAVYLFHYVLIYTLKRWAERTDQKYDDMFVALFHLFGSLTIIAIGGAAILVQYHDLLKESEGVLLPYSIVVSVAGAILGLASREAIENFFGGVLLQIDKPFDLGDRIMLRTGEICEVRQVGMRSTVLYNVLGHNNIYYPNSALAKHPVTNLSRPDTEWRIQLSFYVPTYLHEADGSRKVLDKAEPGLIEQIERNLLDIAYLSDEIDRCRIRKDRLPKWERERERVWLNRELIRLKKQLPKLEITPVSRHGRDVPALDEIHRTLARITLKKEAYDPLVKSAREDNGELNSSVLAKSLHQRLEIMGKIARDYSYVESLVFGLATVLRDDRPEFDRLIGELHKEPRVESEFEVTEDGYTYIRIQFNVFAVHTERRSEVAHGLLKLIQQRFAEVNLPIDVLHPRRVGTEKHIDNYLQG